MIHSLLQSMWGEGFLPYYTHAFDFWNYLWSLDGDCWRC